MSQLEIDFMQEIVHEIDTNYTIIANLAHQEISFRLCYIHIPTN